MSGFIRVRSAVGPAHEFDAPVVEVQAHPADYVLIDTTPVDQPRPVNYTPDEVPAPKAVPAPVAVTDPSVGDNEKEGA